MFIVLEGIDCSGKSSLVSLVAESCGFATYATPPRKYKEMRKSVDTNSSLQKHYDFYRDAIKEASAEIGELLLKGQNVICDRYWLSTLVYHRAGKMDLDGSDFLELVQPDVTILLLVSPEEQVRRSLGRGTESCGIAGMQAEITHLYWHALVEFRLPFVAINTDKFNLQQCVQIISAAGNNKSLTT